MIGHRFQLHLLVSFFIFLLDWQCVSGQQGSILTGNVELKDLSGQPSDFFGFSLSVSSQGNMIGVGAPGANQDRGKMLLFSRKENSWNNQYTVKTIEANPNRDIGTKMGSVVEVEEIPVKAVLFGSPYARVEACTNCGRVYLMRGENIDITHSSVRSFSGFAIGRFDMFFGMTASLSQTFRWAFANPYWGDARGRAVVWEGNMVDLTSNLVGSMVGLPRSFGSVVKLSGNGKRLFSCAVLTQEEIDTGSQACFVFTQLDGGNWTTGHHFFTPYLETSLSLATNFEGTSVAVGVSGNPTIRGWVEYFDLIYSAGVPTVTLNGELASPNIPNQGENIDFGRDLAMTSDGLRLLVYLPGRDVSIGESYYEDAGSCYLYVRNTRGLTFLPEDKLFGTQAKQALGWTVAVGGNVFACGAPGSQSVFVSEISDGSSSPSPSSSLFTTTKSVTMDTVASGSRQGGEGEGESGNGIDNSKTETKVEGDNINVASMLIGVGAGAGAVLILIVIVVICLATRKRRQQTTTQETAGAPPSSVLLSSPTRTARRDSIGSRSRRNSHVRSRSRSRSSKRQSKRISSDPNSNYAAITPLALGNYSQPYSSPLSLPSSPTTTTNLEYHRPAPPSPSSSSSFSDQNRNRNNYNYIQTSEPMSGGGNSFYENVDQPLN